MHRRAAVLLALGLLAGAVPALAAPAAPEDPEALAGWLRQHGLPPAAYVLERARAHRVTILGEGHWLRADVALVRELVPSLRAASIDLAVEWLPASAQGRVDALLAAATWQAAEANALLRLADWPYLDYRDVLQAAWEANRGEGQPLAVVALGPGQRWREELLPLGKSYDGFMADRVLAHLELRQRPLLVHCGMHHAFTRYRQAELDSAGRAQRYMDRMGNTLLRRLGQQVFLITLHKPIWCGDPDQPSYCLPFDGAIDCAAGAAGGSKIGFDVVGTPLAELRFAAADYYAYGHPALRFVDFTDGYVWQGALEETELVRRIALSEYAPDVAALRQVARSRGIAGEVTREQLLVDWAADAQAAREPLRERGWQHLAGWQSRCATPP